MVLDSAPACRALFLCAQSCLDTTLAETVPVPSGVVDLSTKRSWPKTILDQRCHFCRYDFVRNNHPTNSGILFKWLHKEHSSVLIHIT